MPLTSFDPASVGLLVAAVFVIKISLHLFLRVRVTDEEVLQRVPEVRKVSIVEIHRLLLAQRGLPPNPVFRDITYRSINDALYRLEAEGLIRRIDVLHSEYERGRKPMFQRY